MTRQFASGIDLLGQLATAIGTNISATDKLLGRSSAGSGTVEEISCTSAGRAIIAGINASAQRTTLGLGTAAVLNITTSSSSPSGGADGDIWIQYTP